MTPDAGGDASAAGGGVAARRVPPLWIFLVISLPYGILSGGVTGTLLSYLLRSQGVSVGRMANEVSLLLLPATLFFLWSPLADFWLRRRTWLVVASAVAALGVAISFQMDLSGSPAVALLFGSTCCVLVTGACLGGLVAAMVPEEMKVRVSSLHQVGNLGGGALGGGGLMMLSEHLSRPALGWAAATLVFLPSLAALMVDEPEVETSARESLGRRFQQMGVEFKLSFLRWSALPALLLLMSPLGSGGAIGLLPGIARDYGVSGNQVAWLNGMAGGLLTAAGAMLMVLVPGRVDTRLTYSVLGVANALSIGILAVGPTRAATYLVGTVLYLLTVGACWAVFTALVLQVVGGAGRSGCSRFAIAVSLGNAPVAYMAWADGRGAQWFGTRGLAGMDMAASGIVAIGFLVWLHATRASRGRVPVVGVAEADMAL